MIFKQTITYKVILGILKLNLIFTFISLVPFLVLEPTITTIIKNGIYLFFAVLPISSLIYAIYFFFTKQYKSQNTDFKIQKTVTNRTYVIYSLLIPIIYAVMLCINLHFGSTEGETRMRPYGIISDLISFTIFGLLTFLGIKHFILFKQNIYNKNLLNRLMLIFNSIFLVLSYIFMGSALAGGVITVLMVISGLIIPYVIIYILQFLQFLKEE